MNIADQKFTLWLISEVRKELRLTRNAIDRALASADMGVKREMLIYVDLHVDRMNAFLEILKVFRQSR